MDDTADGADATGPDVLGRSDGSACPDGSGRSEASSGRGDFDG
ncbi:hypothetical protein ACF1BU_22645 [Streptomyces sp. NPDC014724]